MTEFTRLWNSTRPLHHGDSPAVLAVMTYAETHGGAGAEVRRFIRSVAPNISNPAYHKLLAEARRHLALPRTDSARAAARNYVGRLLAPVSGVSGVSAQNLKSSWAILGARILERSHDGHDDFMLTREYVAGLAGLGSSQANARVVALRNHGWLRPARKGNRGAYVYKTSKFTGPDADGFDRAAWDASTTVDALATWRPELDTTAEVLATALNPAWTYALKPVHLLAAIVEASGADPAVMGMPAATYRRRLAEMEAALGGPFSPDALEAHALETGAYVRRDARRAEFAVAQRLHAERTAEFTARHRETIAMAKELAKVWKTTGKPAPWPTNADEQRGAGEWMQAATAALASVPESKRATLRDIIARQLTHKDWPAEKAQSAVERILP